MAIFKIDNSIKIIQFLIPYSRKCSKWIVELNIKNGNTQVCVG